METKQFSALICDANVLIDYLSSNKRILKQASLCLAPIYVPLPILSEVSQLSPEEAQELNIRIFEPKLDEVSAASQRGGALSFEDKLCLIIAAKEKWACVTNDKPLRKACERKDIAILWGWDLMVLLNQKGVLPKIEAQRTVKEIKERNIYIKEETINNFLNKLK